MTTSAPQLPPGVARIREIFNSDPSQGRDKDGAWEKMWQEQTTPWDASGIQPALKDLVENGWAKVGVDWSDLASGGEGKALVPGCGRGYDVLYLASKGFQAVGADISATAIAAAREHYASQHSPPPTVTFEQVDFFKDLPEAFYSLAYDYTFFCAIPPSMRSEWAKAYAKTIRPGGVLITLMWPIVGDRPGGPPFSVSPESYRHVLLEDFEKLYEAVPGQSTPDHVGYERIGVWRRR